MFPVSEVKVSELVDITGLTASAISKRLRKVDQGLVTAGNRIVGIKPDAVESLLAGEEKLSGLYDSFITVVGTNVGGVGKTSATVSLAAASRRLISKKKAVVIIDADSQASSTEQIIGDVPDNIPILKDYIDKKCTLDDLLFPIGEPEDNFWIIRSNLDNVYLDRCFSSAQMVRDSIRRLFESIFSRFGEGTKILLDLPPQLSAVSQSACCALAMLPQRSVYLIPMRTDRVSIKGAKICLNEIKSTTASYKGVDHINALCFLSSYDARLKVSVETMRIMLEDDVLKNHICNAVIRYSSEVTKSSMKSQNIYSSGKKSNVTCDYNELALSIYVSDRKSMN